jgi:pyruvate/2-oxoglutarate dehydrogenase complex dihydrolipoamide acyltransferase (E2) component
MKRTPQAGKGKVTVKMSDFEKGMQKTMTEANSIPHFNLMEEIDMTRMVETKIFLPKIYIHNKFHF